MTYERTLVLSALRQVVQGREFTFPSQPLVSVLQQLADISAFTSLYRRSIDNIQFCAL